MKAPRMPRVIRWPFGWCMSVKYRTCRQLAAMGLPDCAGAWVVADRTIYVRKGDHIAEQCETIAHEMQHAATDYRHFVEQEIRIPLLQESAASAMDMAEEDE